MHLMQYIIRIKNDINNGKSSWGFLNFWHISSSSFSHFRVNCHAESKWIEVVIHERKFGKKTNYQEYLFIFGSLNVKKTWSNIHKSPLAMEGMPSHPRLVRCNCHDPVIPLEAPLVPRPALQPVAISPIDSASYLGGHSKEPLFLYRVSSHKSRGKWWPRMFSTLDA